MKIFLTYDFLTTDAKLGKGLCKKLSFIKEVLKLIDIDVSVDDDKHLSFPIKNFYNAMAESYKNLKFNNFNAHNITSSAYRLIHEYIKGYDVLIAYELSVETKKVFDHYNINYIDIWLSPIRFCKDLMFEFYSNNSTIQEKLQNYALKDETLYQAASNLKDYTNSFFESSSAIEPNSLLLIGQLSEDKAVMKDNKFLTLLDFIPQIKELSHKYAKVYFSKHPLMSKEEFNVIFESFRDIENMQALEEGENTYQLLCNQNIDCVVAISSSVLNEAKYFAKDTIYLYKPVLNDLYHRIDKEFYKTAFWSAILGVEHKKISEYLVHDNFLRYKLDGRYSYEIYLNDSQDFTFYNKLLRLQDLLNRLDRDKKYILYGYVLR